MRTQLDYLLKEALIELVADHGPLGPGDLEPRLERTRDPRHGDFTSNVALRIAKTQGDQPREFAAKIIASLPSSPLVEKVEVAGPGFLNFTLTAAAYHQELAVILEQGPRYGCSEIGQGDRILVEYLSANPTGPLHVGHGRHAAYGASVANLLRATGHEVHEEYYVNDAGRQMDILVASVWLRYLELLGQDVVFPPNAYQGGYVAQIAASLHDAHGDALTADAAQITGRVQTRDGSAEKRLDLLISEAKAALGPDRFTAVLSEALKTVLDDIKDDLKQFGVAPQNWYSERSLTVDGAIHRALERLRERGMLYTKDGAKWFRASQFGDEKDRVVVRENGASTYFASDIAYHLEKRERGFTHLLDVLGADHHGYVARVRAGLEAMGEPPECLEVRLVQFVTLYRGEDKVQMSTRSGEYVTLRELREEVGNDAARFFYVSRSNDQHLDFDLELAKAQSNDNPVYYVQYAHARVASLLRRMEEEGLEWDGPDPSKLNRLSEPAEHSLLVTLSRYPDIVQLSAVNRAPQHVVHYLRQLAAGFHSYYNAHRILVEDVELRDARLALALATRQVVHNGLSLLGVSAPTTM